MPRGEAAFCPDLVLEEGTASPTLPYCKATGACGLNAKPATGLGRRSWGPDRCSYSRRACLCSWLKAGIKPVPTPGYTMSSVPRLPGSSLLTETQTSLLSANPQVAGAQAVLSLTVAERVARECPCREEDDKSTLDQACAAASPACCKP